MATLTIPDNIFSRLKRLADSHHRTTDAEGAALLAKNLPSGARSRKETETLSTKVKSMRVRQTVKVDHSIADDLKREGRA